MDKLPLELLSKILLYLSPLDRLNCSLTCHRFADAITSSHLLDDIWLDIAGREMEAATPILVDSRRRYPKLLLYEADLSEFNSDFWRKVSADLRVLELEECSWSPQAFYSILKQSTKLETLKIVKNGSAQKIGERCRNMSDEAYKQISIEEFVPPKGTCYEELRDSLSHLRHLHLDIELTAEILDLLLGLMPNVTSIFLSSSFDENSDFMERLPSILKKNRIVRIGASFYRMRIGSEEVIRFVEITSGSLRELEINGTRLTERACDAIVNITGLCRLTLSGLHRSFNASHFKRLVSNSPDLEILELYDTQHFEDQDMMHLVELKKLRTFSLGGSSRAAITKESPCRLRELSTLVKLDLKGFQVDSRTMRNLGCLTNLRALLLLACRDSECLEAICENFRRLTELDLGEVKNLTDADGKRLCCFKELRSLRFSCGFGFTDFTFERGIGSRALRSLFIEGCSLTNVGLMSIASNHARLEKLVLLDCEKIDGTGIAALLQNEPRIKILYLVNCVLIQSEWRTILRDLCPRLRDWWI